MSNSVAEDRPGKRDRLINGARDTIYRQGVEITTLAQIAEAADVPPGNVYYYFKSKDELVTAAVEAHTQQMRERLSWLEEKHRSPRARLKGFCRQLVAEADQVARWGCPFGSLCSEIEKHDGDLAQAGAELLRTPIAWVEQQFTAMGRRDAHELAFALVASYEGMALLSNTFGDPEVLVREGRRLERWIDALARPQEATVD